MRDMTVVEEVNTYGVEHVQKLTASDGNNGDFFGTSVSLSADKSILIVGARGDDDGGTNTGSVYIYKQNVGEDTYNPEHVQKIIANDTNDYDWFGSSVLLAVDKSILVVGVPGVDDGGDMVGAVYIYKQNVELDTYNPVHIQKLTASDRAAWDQFGTSVSLSVDKSVLVVGAHGDDYGGTNTGSVYIYKQNVGLDTYNPVHIQKLTASDRAAGDLFGASVAISADKSILVVGAIRDDDGGTDTGSVYIYKQNVGLDTYNTTHIQKLTASDRATGDQFGTSVSLSADKSILVVGAHRDDEGGTDTGSVYIYKQNVGADTYNPVHVQKLTASDRTAFDYFGTAVSLSSDKSILVVGAFADDYGSSDTGSVYTYKQT